MAHSSCLQARSSSIAVHISQRSTPAWSRPADHACVAVQRQQQRLATFAHTAAAAPSSSSSSSSSLSPSHQRGGPVAAGPAAMQQSGSMQGQVDPDYLAAASYLAEVGFTNKTEIARVLDIAMNPNSLFVQASVNASARPLTVDADMKPVVEFLQAQGVKAGDIVKVISAHPPVLSYSVSGRLTPFWEYLTSIGVTDVAAAVAKRPSLLGLSVDTGLKKIVEYLQYVETPPEKIVQYICNSI